MKGQDNSDGVTMVRYSVISSALEVDSQPPHLLPSHLMRPLVLFYSGSSPGPLVLRSPLKKGVLFMGPSSFSHAPNRFLVTVEVNVGPMVIFLDGSQEMQFCPIFFCEHISDQGNLIKILLCKTGGARTLG